MNRMMRWFESAHLPPHLDGIASASRLLAALMDERLEESAEKTAGLRKLLEAKDCFVRAAIETDEKEESS